jgi:hypothetical protein
MLEHAIETGKGGVFSSSGHHHLLQRQRRLNTFGWRQMTLGYGCDKSHNRYVMSKAVACIGFSRLREQLRKRSSVSAQQMDSESASEMDVAQRLLELPSVVPAMPLRSANQRINPRLKEC